MNFTVARPYAFYALFILAPVLTYYVLRCKKILSVYKENKKKFLSTIIPRTACRVAAYILIVFAYADISWGTTIVPVKRSGNAVAFVFDISYSMEAQDAPGSMTRLTSAASYAQELLDRMEGTSVSVVLTKGEGLIAIPLTQDFQSVQTLLNMLTPELMATVGTNLGNGIEKAINSFPTQSSMAPHIWVFTDGDESSDNYIRALEHTVEKGIPLTVIGFGSERETEVLAGDRKTYVKTALRSKQIESSINYVLQNSIKDASQKNLLSYVDASELSSANGILSTLKSAENTEDVFVNYEVQPVERKDFFIITAIIFFILSFIFAELGNTRKYTRNLSSVLMILLVSSVFTGCSSRLENGISILQGKMAWNRKDYQSAVAYFLQAAEDAHERGDFEYEQFALYDLASTYLMQDETDAALQRFEQIAPDVSDNVKFAIMYNSGIIAHRKGAYDEAIDCFKQALEIDSTNTNAKINLELSLRSGIVHTNAGEAQLTPVSETQNSNVLEEAIYSIIRETDQNKWKNHQQEQESSSKDY